MQKLMNFLKNQRDSLLLSLALLCLVVALFHPSIPLKHNIYTYFLVADISQSMNTQDMLHKGKPASRMVHMQKLMRQTISSLPCGTKVSIGLFAGVSVAALYHPIEVCENFAALQDTIDHLDWRTIWSGNSRIREGLFAINRSIRTFPESAQVVFFTDGEEMPKLHLFNKRSIDGFQGADGWLLVGIGSEKGGAIPKLSDDNQVIGYWSNEAFAVQPGIAQISASNLGARDDKVAAGLNDRYVSKLDAPYLKEVAKTIGADYIEGKNFQSLLAAMKKQKPARRDIAPFDLHQILAGLSGVLLLSAYVSKSSLMRLLSRLGLGRKRKLSRQKTATMAHDNATAH